jgi:UDP-N-acetylmuramoyl-tripeptide--D-alanyl-D-alanine ligase
VSAVWTSHALSTAVGGRVAGALPEAITGVSIDSRTIAPGEVFFAIRGENFDGHDFVAAALERGAGAAVVAESKLAGAGLQAGPLVVVPDVLEALRKLGVAARARTAARIIGITGSVGKTGTKEALKLALSRSGSTHASAASYNNHWGVPLSLARMPEETAYGVFEMGMNAPGEIAALTRMVRPHIAIVTTVAPVHLEFFGSVDEIADAKAEIFEGLEPDGTALINADIPAYGRLAERARAHGARVVGFGESADAEIRLRRIALHPDCSCVDAEVMGTAVTYKIGAPGQHLVANSLAVLGAAQLAGADLALAALSLAELRAPAGRGAHVTLALPGGKVTLIDESYNANPASMRAALSLLGRSAPGFRGRRIAVLGDMLELGETSNALHAELADVIEREDIDLVFAAGPRMAALWADLAAERRGHYADGSDGLVAPLLEELCPGDVVMVKGSLGSRMGPIVEALKARHAVADPGAA